MDPMSYEVIGKSCGLDGGSLEYQPHVHLVWWVFIGTPNPLLKGSNRGELNIYGTIPEYHHFFMITGLFATVVPYFLAG